MLKLTVFQFSHILYNVCRVKYTWLKCGKFSQLKNAVEVFCQNFQFMPNNYTNLRFREKT